MKDYSWMKAINSGVLVERFSVKGKPCAICARGSGAIAAAHPAVYTFFLFSDKDSAPEATIVLEETLLGDYCLSVTEPGAKSPKKAIVSHFSFLPDYPAFRTKAVSLAERFLRETGKTIRLPPSGDLFFDADMA
jgi:hypothetical protein